jgi:hypothetical protein
MAITSLTKHDTEILPVGTPVFCTVHGCEGWYTLTAVRPRDGYIKVRGVNTWNPPFNFSLTAPVRHATPRPTVPASAMAKFSNRHED